MTSSTVIISRAKGLLSRPSAIVTTYTSVAAELVVGVTMFLTIRLTGRFEIATFNSVQLF